MFRSAATKIAHNSTLPALAGNKDLRPLQELITSEKAVLQSLQRLSSDLMKSSECLRHWGTGEGDDLQDTLATSTTLIGHLSSALSQLATHEVSIREHMKAVRTREENLDELRRRRKAVSAKADTAEKRLSKMSPEHKSLQQQTELLNNLREQIRNLDWEILSEEAKLGDFKRSSTKSWMVLKFGGILECAEKATIVAEMGKLIIEEIPLDVTQPGQTRSFYTGHEKTEKIVAEAQRCISEVVFDPQPVSSSNATKSLVPDGNRGSIDGLPSGGNLGPSAYLQETGMTSSSGFGLGPSADEFGGLGDRRASRGYGTMPIPMPGGSVRTGDDSSRLPSTIGEGSTSNFGSSIASPTSPPASRFGSSGGGQFSTFPTRKASLPSAGLGSPPPPNQSLSFQPLDEGSGSTSSFAAEVADALAYAENDGQAAQPVQGKFSLDGPAPSYEQHAWNTSITPSGLPRGAAPPAVERNPWDNVPPAPLAPPHNIEHQSVASLSPLPPHPPSNHVRESENADGDEESQLPYASPPPTEPQLPNITGEHASRHVHFGNGQPESETHGHGQTEGIPSIHERIPSPPPLNDVEASNAAAAREVAREMDMLSFNPPPGPPPGHIGNRTPSPLLPPAPPFAQQRVSPAPDYGGNLSPRSEGIFNGSKTDLRGLPTTSNIEPSNLQVTGNAPPSPSATHPTRPSMSVNMHSPAPSYSFNSTAASTYGTPPEMPAIQPLRTGSPASPSILAPGARTISAAAFKRPGIRSPSGGQPSDSRPLPDVSPLSLRKKSASGPGLPGSPYAGSREALPNPPQGQGQESQEQEPPRTRQSNESSIGPAPDYDNSYEFISSYSDSAGDTTQAPHTNGEGAGSPGYGRGKFATNLDGEGLR